jgi:hypothetical protein
MASRAVSSVTTRRTSRFNCGDLRQWRAALIASSLRRYRIRTHREAVSHELSRLGSIGLLRRESGDLRITDLACLKNLAREAKCE